jgi:LPXTG-motif cell wall-anchored protein
MARSEKEVLSEYGYLAILEAAEGGLIISYPPPPEIDDQTPQTPAVPVAPSDDGCSAVLVSGAPAMLALIAAAGWMLRKKKK